MAKGSFRMATKARTITAVNATATQEPAQVIIFIVVSSTWER